MVAFAGSAGAVLSRVCSRAVCPSGVTKVLEHFPQEVYPLRLCWEGYASALAYPARISQSRRRLAQSALVAHSLVSQAALSTEATWQPKLRKNCSSTILQPPTWKLISHWSSCAWSKKRPS